MTGHLAIEAKYCPFNPFCYLPIIIIWMLRDIDLLLQMNMYHTFKHKHISDYPVYFELGYFIRTDTIEPPHQKTNKQHMWN